MDKHIKADDLREEIAYWRMTEDDALLRGGEQDWKIAQFASSQRRKFTRQLVELLNGKSREEYHADYLRATTYEKQPTGVGAGELSRNARSNFHTAIISPIGGDRNAEHQFAAGC